MEFHAGQSLLFAILCFIIIQCVAAATTQEPGIGGTYWFEISQTTKFLSESGADERVTYEHKLDIHLNLYRDVEPVWGIVTLHTCRCLEPWQVQSLDEGNRDAYGIWIYYLPKQGKSCEYIEVELAHLHWQNTSLPAGAYTFSRTYIESGEFKSYTEPSGEGCLHSSELEFWGPFIHMQQDPNKIIYEESLKTTEQSQQSPRPSTTRTATLPTTSANTEAQTTTSTIEDASANQASTAPTVTAATDISTSVSSTSSTTQLITEQKTLSMAPANKAQTATSAIEAASTSTKQQSIATATTDISTAVSSTLSTTQLITELTTFSLAPTNEPAYKIATATMDTSTIISTTSLKTQLLAEPSTTQTMASRTSTPTTGLQTSATTYKPQSAVTLTMTNKVSTLLPADPSTSTMPKISKNPTTSTSAASTTVLTPTQVLPEHSTAALTARSTTRHIHTTDTTSPSTPSTTSSTASQQISAATADFTNTITSSKPANNPYTPSPSTYKTRPITSAMLTNRSTKSNAMSATKSEKGSALFTSDPVHETKSSFTTDRTSRSYTTSRIRMSTQVKLLITEPTKPTVTYNTDLHTGSSSGGGGLSTTTTNAITTEEKFVMIGNRLLLLILILGNINIMFGQCRLCNCEYMGTGDHSCGCGHASANHIKLESCSLEDCECAEFISVDNVPQCYTCLHGVESHQHSKKGDTEYNQLRAWVAQGVKRSEMLPLYAARFGENISVRTLHRRLASYGLRGTDGNITDEEILSLVRTENENGVVGYKTMHTVLRSKHNLLVSRDRLHFIMRTNEGIPKGRDPKTDNKKYHQRPFLSLGPNWLWAADGHEKLVQPFGSNLYIYGLIDTFSRKVLALNVIPNKKMTTVGNWLLKSINSINGMPQTIMLDKGTEWNECIPNMPIIQMKSTFNQKIEAFWSQMTGHSDIPKFREVLSGLENDGYFTAKSEKERWAIWMAFHRPVQDSLNNFRSSHNAHRIRKQHGVNLPTGHCPDVMWENANLFQTTNYIKTLQEKIPLLPDEATAYEEKYQICDALKERVKTSTKNTCVILYHDIREKINE